ncbi:complex I intermediate-associated protein CIA30 [Flagelloscypha sp. PMI_526]|nr:complex I intermediate-associated protein CIA30 [Flagelloscypha sp. PMI_526]
MAQPTHFQRYVQRSLDVVRKKTWDSVSIDTLTMAGANPIDRSPRTLITWNSEEDIASYNTGADEDVGGYSTANLSLNTSPELNKPVERTATGMFWGQMRLDIKPELADRVRPGYAGFRTKKRPTLFGDLEDDLSFHHYLVLRARVSGDPETRNAYYMNLRTAGYATHDIWQHRLYFRYPEKWEDIYIPICDFVRTNKGQISKKNLTMWTERVNMFGISMLGGNSNSEGNYELGLDSLRMVNQEDCHPDDLPSLKNVPSA